MCIFYKEKNCCYLVEGSVQKATLSMLKPDGGHTQRENEDMHRKEDQENNVKEMRKEAKRRERERAYFPNLIYHCYSIYSYNEVNEHFI